MIVQDCTSYVIQVVLLQNQVPTVGLDSHPALQVAGSSIWAQQQPIKCLEGLVRNLLAVSR